MCGHRYCDGFTSLHAPIPGLRAVLCAVLLTAGLLSAARAQTAQPYAGTPIPVPATFEAENFDLGGEGVAYHDNVKGNSGGQHRISEDVDIIASSDSLGGGYVVNNFETGEWLAYTVNVSASAKYDIEIRASTTFSSSAFHIEIDGTNVTGSIAAPDTGSWSTFQWIGKKGVVLAAGTHVLKIVADQQYFNLNSLRLTATADTQAPSIPANLAASGVSASQVNLSWSAAADNVGVTGYRVYRDGTLVASPTSTSVSIAGLSPGTLYAFTVSAVDASGNASAQSAPLSVTTQVIFSTLDPYLGDAANWEPLTASRWSVVADGGDLRYGINTTAFTDLPTSRLGEYSLVKGRSYGDFAFAARVRSTEDFAANPGADYAVVFGWQDADNYYYAMLNRAAANTELFKVIGGVRQPALASANFALPDNNYHLVAVARTGSLITVSFDGVPIMQASDATFGAGRIGIGGFNDAAWWDDILIAVAATSDTQPPTVPANVTVTALTSSEITLSWSAATDDVGVTGYRVYRDGTLVASPAGTSASITGLSASTPYAFTVSAVDAVGNASAQSSPLSVTTLATADTTPPSVPTDLVATVNSPVNLAWTASADNVGVTGYRVYRDGTLVASPAGTSVSITGLSASTLYAFTVSAVDAAGNASAQSAPLSVTTPAPATSAAADCANPSSGYEGFGRNTTGGAGKPVYRVTNLNNSGVGSLRDAIAAGNRCVVFDVGGTINLSSMLLVNGASITIDGFTAPSPGVTLRNYDLVMHRNRGANNVIVRGLRSRDAFLSTGSNPADGIAIIGVSNIVIDHVSVAGFGDGAIDVTDDAHDVTIQWSIFAQGNPAHNFVSLISYDTTRITVHHNLFINGQGRNPMCAASGATSNPAEVVCDVRNNLVWNYSQSGTSVRHYGTANVVNNYYYSSTQTSNPANALMLRESSVAHASGNFSQNGLNVDAQGNRSTPFAAVVPTTTDAITAAHDIVARAGARGPNFGWDTIDQNRIAQISLTRLP